MVDAPVESDSPPDLCDGSSCVLSRCVLRERVGLYSWLKSLRRAFCSARSSAWHVMDLVIGLSGRVGSLGRLRLTIQPPMFVCAKTQLTRRAKCVAN